MTTLDLCRCCCVASIHSLISIKSTKIYQNSSWLVEFGPFMKISMQIRIFPFTSRYLLHLMAARYPKLVVYHSLTTKKHLTADKIFRFQFIFTPVSMSLHFVRWSIITHIHKFWSFFRLYCYHQIHIHLVINFIG